MTVLVDAAELRAAWAKKWPSCRPIAPELRECAADRWVRFHSLPGSKRYPETDAERKEILHRHNTVIEELLTDTPASGSTLLVVTCAYSGDSKPVPRHKNIEAVSPGAVYWQEVLDWVDEDDGDERWLHLYVEAVAWEPGLIDGLLLAAAEWAAADVIIAPLDLDWLYHPYDGGADVIAVTPERRDALREDHRVWLSSHPKGL